MTNLVGIYNTNFPETGELVTNTMTYWPLDLAVTSSQRPIFHGIAQSFTSLREICHSITQRQICHADPTEKSCSVRLDYCSQLWSPSYQTSINPCRGTWLTVLRTRDSLASPIGRSFQSLGYTLKNGGESGTR